MKGSCIILNKYDHTRKGDTMNYKKYTNNAFNIHIITTDKFKTISLKVNFKKKIEKKDITYRNLLTKILLQSNKQYKDKQVLEIATEELYNIGISASNYISGNYIITSFNSTFLNENYTEKGMNEKSIKFFLDLIFKPNVSNKQFAYFDLAQRLVKDEIAAIKDDPKSYSVQRLVEEMDEKSYNPIGYLDDLENIDNDNLYNYYENMLKSDLIDIFIIGNFSADEMKNFINEKFSVNTIKKPSKSHFIVNEKIRKKPQNIVEKLPLEQAKLCLGFKLENLTEFEIKYVMSIYCYILGGGPDSKLFKNVREKHSLCYSISCFHRPVTNTMIITAGINKEDAKKCISLIKKEMTKINKGDFEDNDIESAKIIGINALKEIEDYQASIIKIFESHEYLNFDLLDERSLSINNVTKQDVINLSKKIHLDTIYLLEGDTYEEN